MWWIILGVVLMFIAWCDCKQQAEDVIVKQNIDGHICDFEVIKEQVYVGNDDLDYGSYNGTKYTYKCNICGKVIERWYKL